jgi:hypothetical protein
MMSEHQISDQGYLEPATRLANCHFGQLILLAMYGCSELDMKN